MRRLHNTRVALIVAFTTAWTFHSICMRKSAQPMMPPGQGPHPLVLILTMWRWVMQFADNAENVNRHLILFLITLKKKCTGKCRIQKGQSHKSWGLYDCICQKKKKKSTTLRQANDIVQKSELERLLIPGGKPFVVTLSNDACFWCLFFFIFFYSTCYYYNKCTPLN